QVLGVVVRAVVDQHLANTEQLAQLVKTCDASCALRHRELVSHLIPGRVAAAIRAASLAHEADREAAFSVYKTNDPTNSDQSFLLIVRTRQIVTFSEPKVLRDTRMFQHLARFY